MHHGIVTMRDRVNLIARMIDSSIRKPQEKPDGSKYLVRDLAVEIVRGTPQHGTAYEDACISSVFKWVKCNIEYRQDPVDYDYYMAAGRTINSGAGDCFTLDTKIIVRKRGGSGRGVEKSLGELQSCWSEYEAKSFDFEFDEWVYRPITGWIYKGVRPVLVTRLRACPYTGLERASMRHTEDHRVWTHEQGGVYEAPLGDWREDLSRPLIVAPSISPNVLENRPMLSWAPVESMEPDGEAEVADITVDGTHNFVLANGVIAHNCDDHTILNCALLNALGFRTGARIVSPDGAAWHIYALAGARTFSNPSIVVPLDTTQTESSPGWEPPPVMRRYELQTEFRLGKAPWIYVNRWAGNSKRGAKLSTIEHTL